VTEAPQEQEAPQEHAVVGTVDQLQVFPVRSLAGRAVPEVRVAGAGLVGDRLWTVVDAATGERVTPREAPALHQLVASGDAGADTALLAEVLGRPVRLAEAGSGAGREGVAPVHLVSRQALARAAAGDVPEGCSGEDPRANVLLDLGDGGDERTWVGRRLRVGEAELEVTRLPRHCLGVYAEVRRPGRVRVGDAVRLGGAPAKPGAGAH
jgi:uncharacterized protein YcbX